jgi:hypothetical protein
MYIHQNKMNIQQTSGTNLTFILHILENIPCLLFMGMKGMVSSIIQSYYGIFQSLDITILEQLLDTWVSQLSCLQKRGIGWPSLKNHVVFYPKL